MLQYYIVRWTCKVFVLNKESPFGICEEKMAVAIFSAVSQPEESHEFQNLERQRIDFCVNTAF